MRMRPSLAYTSRPDRVPACEAESIEPSSEHRTTVAGAWVCSTARTSWSPACSPTPRSPTASPGSPSAEGAEIVLTGAGRALSLTQRTARKLPRRRRGRDPRVRARRHRARAPRRRCATTLAARWGRVDGVLHAIGFAPPSLPRRRLHGRQWDDVAVALHISAYSLKALADAFVPLMTDGGAFVGLDFDNRWRGPAYNWMGVAKSALQSVSRYLAASSDRAGSAATWSPPVRCARWPPRASPGSPSSRTSGTTARRSAGTSPTPSRSPRRAWRCCPTGSPPPPARSSTSTAASTRRVPPGVGRARLDGVNRLAGETSPYLRQHRDNPVDWYPWGPEASPPPSSATCRSCCASATRPATGAT